MGKNAEDDNLEKATMKQITKIEKEYETNKSQVIDFLVERIMDVQIEFPENLKKKL